MSSAITFHDEAEFFITEAEQSLLSLEQCPTEERPQRSTVNILRTLRGIADLFNMEKAHLILTSVADSFDQEIGQTVPAELINNAITLIDQLRSMAGDDFTTKECKQIMAMFAPFHNGKGLDKITKKQPGEIHIMVVDDELVNRTLLVEFIKTFHPDITVTAVDSATEAIYHYLCEDFDLIFLDIMMPEVDGNHFIAIVEKNRSLGNLTGPANIVVQTAVQSLSELLSIVQHECVLEVIRKPIHRERISTCIERYCSPFNRS